MKRSSHRDEALVAIKRVHAAGLCVEDGVGVVDLAGERVRQSAPAVPGVERHQLAVVLGRPAVNQRIEDAWG